MKGERDMVGGEFPMGGRKAYLRRIATIDSRAKVDMVWGKFPVARKVLIRSAYQ